MLDKITAQEFSLRRDTLMQQLEDNSAVVIQSATMQKRNSDVDYLFRQDSTFFYFTGFDEPDALLLLKKNAGKIEYHLFCQPRNKEMEIWFGYRCGEQGVLETTRQISPTAARASMSKCPCCSTARQNSTTVLREIALLSKCSHGWAVCASAAARES